MHRLALAICRSLFVLFTSALFTFALAAPPGKGCIACPKWDYGWVATPQSAVTKFMWTQQVRNSSPACTVELNGQCVASGPLNYDNPNIYVCPVHYGGGVGCVNGDATVSATGRDGLNHTTPIIANEGSTFVI